MSEDVESLIAHIELFRSLLWSPTSEVDVMGLTSREKQIVIDRTRDVIKGT